jgi:hypothetical protein
MRITGIGIPRSQSKIGMSTSMLVARVVGALWLLNGLKLVLDP